MLCEGSVRVLEIKRLYTSVNIWGVLSWVFVLLILLPNANILVNVFSEPNENWDHIKEYLLRQYISNTVLVTSLSGLFAAVIGTSLAWVVSVYDFPLRGFLKWGLVLPLAIPPYIAAYTYNGMLNYTGVLQTFLRNSLNIYIDQRYVDIMSLQGAVFIFTLFLYPYVYTITKAFLEKQSSSLIENARVLGRSPLEVFLFVILPVSRAAIVGGTTLVMLEVLNDYGVVKYFGITTFSTAIFQTWFGMGDVDSAIKLAAMLMLLVFAITMSERALRGRRRFSYTTTKARPISRIRLKGLGAVLASGYTFMIFSLGFLIPTLQLIHWALQTYRRVLGLKFLELTLNSLLMALGSAALIVCMAVVIANYSRISETVIARTNARVTIVGYSIPGAVIAIGVIVVFVALDNHLYWLYRLIDPDTPKLVLTTSLVMLMFAYTIRFIAIAVNSVESGFEKVGKKFFEASRTLGMNVTRTFFKVDLRMIQPALLSGFLLVFVDIMKELPLTLILRPFNFDTLATKSFQYAHDEMIHEAAISSLIIILVSFASIYFFHRVADKEER